MRKLAVLTLVLAGGMSVGACATHDRYGYDRYGYERERNRDLEGAARGAAIGAAGGAAVGAVVDGIGPLEGAAAGAAVGAVVGAATTDDDDRWHRDQYGRCFYLDSRGNRVYDPRVRC